MALKSLTPECIAEIDLAFENFVAKHKIPGAIYSLIDGKNQPHIKAVGVSNLETKSPVTSQTQFRIASMSKSFIGLSTLILRDRSLLALDDEISKYLGQQINDAVKASQVTTDSPPLTIRKVLNMVGGFPTDDPWADRLLDYTRDDYNKLLASGLTHSNVVGVEWEYSNTLYMLLGLIVEKAAGMPYQKFVHQEILQPLGMTQTTYEYSHVKGDMSSCYRWTGENWRQEEILHDGIFGSMGGLITTIPDFAKYVSLHLDSWPPRSGDDSGIVKRSVLREMHRPQEVWGFDWAQTDPPSQYFTAFSCGLRWCQDVKDQFVWVGHAGGLPGWGSDWRFLPEYGLGIVSFGNLTYSPMIFWTQIVMYKLMSLKVLPKQLTAKKSHILETRTEQLLRIIKANWESEEPLENVFAFNFFLDKEISDWKKINNQLFPGGIKHTGEVVRKNELYGTVKITCGNDSQVSLTVRLNPETPPKIQGLIIKNL